MIPIAKRDGLRMFTDVKWLSLIAVWLGLSVVDGNANAALSSNPETSAPKVGEIAVIPIAGEISKAQFYFVRRALKVAQEQKASAIIIDMNTFGGDAIAATQILDALFRTTVPTITYVNPNAGSAGAVIALGAKKIYMAPVSAIGAAAPVGGNGEDLSKTMKEKTVSYLSGYLRSAAEKNGYNPDLARAFMDSAQEVKIGDEVVHQSGSLLTLSAQEATRLVAGKPLLATGVAESTEELVAKEKLSGALVRIEPTGFENLALWLTTLAPLLLIGGMVLGYIELKTAGFGLAGFGAAICFGLFFLGQFVAGLAGWEVAALFFLGALLVLGELFVHPGTIIPGFLGLLLMVGALVWAMVDRYPGDSWWPTADMLLRPLGTLTLSLVLASVAIAALAKWLPDLPLLRGLVLQQTNPVGPSLPGVGVNMNHSFPQVSAGMEGTAVTTLRPSGKAKIGENVLDVLTEGEFVSPYSAVRVIEITGNRVVVKAV